MGRQKLGERVIGPYPRSGGWRVIIRDARPGESGSRTFATREKALEYKRDYEKDLVRTIRTLAEAFDAYKAHLIEKGNKERSYTETLRRLKRFFPAHDKEVSMLAPTTCAAYYRTLVDAGLKPDSHRNYLLEARSFLRWCVEQRWLNRNPLEGLAGVGKRSHGKEQLRFDEARKWRDKALELARGGEAGAVAALMTLLMGMRAGEVVSRVVRDLDDGGRLLWIPQAKTEAGRRTLEVPRVLRPLLKALTKGRKAEELIFGQHWRDWPREWVQRICTLAGVPQTTAHGMRGTFATLASVASSAPELVAQSLGHESYETTERSYADGEALERKQRRQAMKVLDGGRRR